MQNSLCSFTFDTLFCTIIILGRSAEVAGNTYAGRILYKCILISFLLSIRYIEHLGLAGGVGTTRGVPKKHSGYKYFVNYVASLLWKIFVFCSTLVAGICEKGTENIGFEENHDAKKDEFTLDWNDTAKAVSSSDVNCTLGF